VAKITKQNEGIVKGKKNAKNGEKTQKMDCIGYTVLI